MKKVAGWQEAFPLKLSAIQQQQLAKGPLCRLQVEKDKGNI